MNKGEQAYWAEEALKVTADAFDDVQKRMLKTIIDAQSADDAWNAVLAYRGLTEARKQLNAYVDTGKIERRSAQLRTDET